MELVPPYRTPLTQTIPGTSISVILGAKPGPRHHTQSIWVDPGMLASRMHQTIVASGSTTSGNRQRPLERKTEMIVLSFRGMTVFCTCLICIYAHIADIGRARVFISLPTAGAPRSHVQLPPLGQPRLVTQSWSQPNA